MNRELLEKGLAEAEHRVAMAARHLAYQLEFVARLERDGRDPSQAMHLLQEFEELQALHMADRAKILSSYRADASSTVTSASASMMYQEHARYLPSRHRQRG